MPTPALSRSRMRLRRGFSMMELLIVVVIAGILAMAAVPRMRRSIAQREVQAVRERVESMIGTARAAAIHKGRHGLFYVSGNWISVWTMNPNTGSWESVTPWQFIPNHWPNVSLQVGGSGYWYVWYDKRGMTYSKPPSTTIFRVVRGTFTDSVCVTRMGQILPRNCTV